MEMLFMLPHLLLFIVGFGWVAREMLRSNSVIGFVLVCVSFGLIAVGLLHEIYSV